MTNLFKQAGIVSFVISFNVNAQGGFTEPLTIPDTINSNTVHLYVKDTVHEFVSGIETNTYGISASYLGPTIIMDKGDFVQLNVHNLLDETTTMHWHGMHVAPEDDGGPHTAILAGETWSPDFTVLDEATTFWYHPHLHEKTNEHVSKGAAGMIIIRDEEEAALALPRTYGIDDIPMILQSKAFNASWQIEFGGGTVDDVMLVNGVIEPYVDVPAQMVRFRMLNGSTGRTFNIGVSDNRNIFQIGSDGGLLNAPVTLNRIVIAPGERMEFVIDLSGDESETLYLKSYASEFSTGITGAAGGPGATNVLDGADFNVMQLRVTSATTGAITSLPTVLNDLVPIAESSADLTRTLTLDGGGPGNPFTIDGQEMDMEVINQTVELDATEIWEIVNETPIAHPFHIHDIQFYILDRDGVAPPANEQGRKDVVFVYPEETVRFIGTFEDFANEEIPYMYHCHILTHEDGGMMGQFIVVDNSESSVNDVDVNSFSAFPNPTEGSINIQATENGSYKITNAIGQDVLQGLYQENSSIDLSSLETGIYQLVATSNSGLKSTMKVVKK